MQTPKLLFTPGPLTTSPGVKQAAMKDLGSRDKAFIEIVRSIRTSLLELAHVSSPLYEAVLMQGSGTFGIESTISSIIPPDGLLLNIVNGAYGRRISLIASIYKIPVLELVYEENEVPDLDELVKTLISNPGITHVAVVHGETTTGLLNPIEAIGKIVADFNKVYIVDAMSTFGAYDIDLIKHHISFLVSSSNKCIEGIPGFSFIIGLSKLITESKSNRRSLSLDLFSQWEGLESDGQFRFTPPVQILIAFHQALIELSQEGGVAARGKRYQTNNELLVSGMRDAGFKVYLDDKIRSHIITSFYYPEDPNFSFESFYQKLNEKGFVIYPGKLSKVDCFRMGNIGQLFPEDIRALLKAVHETIKEMNLDL